MSQRQWPAIYRKVTFGDTDSTGAKLKFGGKYIQEGLVPSASGSVLKFGATEKLTLFFAKQPINKTMGSADAINRIPMADGSYHDVIRRSRTALITETWSFNCENLSRSEAASLKNFLKKVGNHQLIRVDDPDGNVIYGKIEGDIQINEFVRIANYTLTIRQVPGVTSL